MFHGFLLSCHSNGIILEHKEKYRNQAYAINNIQQYMAYCSVYFSTILALIQFKRKWNNLTFSMDIITIYDLFPSSSYTLYSLNISILLYNVLSGFDGGKLYSIPSTSDLKHHQCLPYCTIINGCFYFTQSIIVCVNVGNKALTEPRDMLGGICLPSTTAPILCRRIADKTTVNH